MYSSKDIEYRSYTLGDAGVIELLISYRYKYDSYKFLGKNSAWESAEALGLNEEMITTYASLDKLIEKCDFSDLQRNIIRLIEEGYTHQEIGFELDVLPSTISGRLKTIYKRIERENDWNWRASTYKNKVGLKTKRCSKCKKELPGTVEFYSDYSRSRDGFHSQCRKCRR